MITQILIAWMFFKLLEGCKESIIYIYEKQGGINTQMDNYYPSFFGFDFD